MYTSVDLAATSHITNLFLLENRAPCLTLTPLRLRHRNRGSARFRGVTH